VSDNTELVLYAGGVAAMAALAGGVLLAWLRRRSVRAQAIAVSLTSIVALGAGIAVAADRMFISSHDLDALLVMLVAAGGVGVVAAVVLGNRVAEASRSVGRLARRIGDGGGAAISDPSRPATVELAALARELESMAARLDESRERERALESSRRELVAWVSHDLRTPLAGIRAMVEALEDGVADDPATVDRYHRTIREEADRLAGLVDDLFELSRIHAGALQLAPEPVALGQLVSDAVAGATVVAETKGVRLEGRVNGDDPVVPLSTPEVLRVLRNLLDNAIRHTPTDGTVVVEAGVAADGDAAFVTVKDGCGGIPPDDLERVFDVAFRGDGARTPGDAGGAGLGLAIARGIVEAHQGLIAVANEDGGCRFTIRLPLD